MIKAMKQALEALEEINKLSIGENAVCLPAKIDTAMDAIKQALAQPEQEPVAWFSPAGNLYRTRFHAAANGEQGLTPLYTSPPQRQPLMDEEIEDAVLEADLDWQQGWTLDDNAPNRFATFARAIEAAHGIKGEA